MPKPKLRSNQRTILSSEQKVPFVCFRCRISTRISLSFYYEEVREKRWASQSKAQCPRCKAPMAFVGRYFKVPPQIALNQWRKVELLWQSGWTADGYSASPDTLRDAREFIQNLNTPATKPTWQRRYNAEERWRCLRKKREHLRRHKAA